ncbi:hypothetical protein [Cytobacillus praedii]|uniref:hypothetical protein n=1 Tax=Cytobacillus praedii TaxID=1742358 RepID=UPI002E21C9A9|nr:hypothetical protein [Cytobacillus praedii]
MGYLQELDALGRWVFSVAKLKSHRLSAAPPQVARPVILWEGPTRTKGENLGRYHFTRKTSQYGVLYVSNLDQLADLMDKLEKDLGDRDEWLPIFETDQPNAVQVGKLRKVQIEFNTTQAVNIPIIIRYEVTYSRPTPVKAPAAVSVGNKIKLGGGQVDSSQ